MPSMPNHPWFQESLVSLYLVDPNSVATVMTDVFQINGIYVARQFAKILEIFDKMDNVNDQGFIEGH